MSAAGRFNAHRRVLPNIEARGLFDGAFGGDDSETTTTSTTPHTSTITTSATASTTSGITLPGLPIISNPLGQLSTILLPSSAPASTHSLSSSVVLVPSSVPPTTTSAPHSTTTPAPTSVLSTSVYVTSSGGAVVTITSTGFVFGPGTSAALSTSSAEPKSTHVPKSFLDNKPLAGAVFGIVSIVALAILISITTVALRRSRRSKLEREALDNEGIAWPGMNNDTHGGAGGPNAALAAGVARAGSMRSALGSTEKVGYPSDGMSSAGHGTAETTSPYAVGYGGAPLPPAPSAYYAPPPPPTPPPVYPAAYAQAMSPPPPPQMHHQPQMSYNPMMAPPAHLPQVYEQPSFGAYYPNPYDLGSQGSGFAPPGLMVASPPPLAPSPTGSRFNAPGQRTSFINANATSNESPPVSPVSEANANTPRRRTSSHARELDPRLQSPPVMPTLPDQFGQAHGGDGALKITNQ